MAASNLVFKQYYLGCLSQASYLIGDRSTGRAVVVDPLRDIDQYLADAREMSLTIEAVFETHFHADFLSGHLELAKATGAEIVYGVAAADRVGFPIRAMGDREHLSLGIVDLEVLSTPGHTPESICIVVREDGPTSAPYGVLTGDTLFIGDVGRPDLLSSVGVTATDLGRQLYSSLHDKLMVLPDETKVYPAHGAGSACGKNLSTETVSTIGEQRRTNYALAPMSVEEFVEAVTQGQSAAPMYFMFAANRNREAHDLLPNDVTVASLTMEELLAKMADGAVVIDTREGSDFALGHVRGSVNVGLSGRFADYVGQVVKPGTPIVLVGDEGTAREATIRLARIGFDSVVGALESPLSSFLRRQDVIEQSSRLTFDAFAERIASVRDLVTVDVRNVGEVELGTVPGSRNIPIAQLFDRAEELDRSAPIVVFCAGGYRSMIASSLLRAKGFTDVSDVIGGYGAWADKNLPATIPSITVEELRRDRDSYLVLDVREDDEWEHGHVDGSMHIPMAQLPARLAEIPTTHRVACLCRSGNRSAKVTAWLLANGVDALNVQGGTLAWDERGFPLAVGAQA